MDNKGDKYEELIDQILKVRYTDPDKWWECAKKLLAVAVEDNNIDMQARAYMEFGSCRFLQSELEEAASYMRKSVRLAKKSANSGQLGNSYGMLGVICTRQEMEVLAIEYFYEAIEVLKAIGDYASLSVHYQNLGTMYYQLGEYEKALVSDLTAKHYETLLPEGRNSGYAPGMEDIMDNLNPVLYLEKLGRLDEMGEKIAIIEKAHEENNVVQLSQYVYVACAKYYYDIGDYNKFKELLGKIVEEAKKIGYGMDVIRDIMDLFDDAITLRDMPYAEELISIAYETGLNCGSNNILVGIYRRYLLLFERTRKPGNLGKLASSYSEALIKRDEELRTLCKNGLENLIERDENEKKGIPYNSEEESVNSYDALTGLPNKYFLNVTMEEMYHVCATEFRKFGIMIVNIDDYTGLRRRAGHLNSDYILQKTANIISETVGGCFAARYGRDEFCVVSRDLNNEDLHRYAVCIQERLGRIHIPKEETVDNSEVNITASIGIYNAIPVKNVDLTEFIHRADNRMYNAKSAGKNRIELEI